MKAHRRNILHSAFICSLLAVACSDSEKKRPDVDGNGPMDDGGPGSSGGARSNAGGASGTGNAGRSGSQGSGGNSGGASAGSGGTKASGGTAGSASGGDSGAAGMDSTGDSGTGDSGSGSGGSTGSFEDVGTDTVTAETLTLAPDQPVLVASSFVCKANGDQEALAISEEGIAVLSAPQSTPLATQTCDGKHTWSVVSSTVKTLAPGYHMVTAENLSADGAYSLVVTNLDGKGAETWKDTFATAKTSAEPQFIAFGGDGHTNLMSTAGGQLPGSPVAAANQPAFSRYDAQGNREWVRQFTKPTSPQWAYSFFAEASAAAVDPSGNLYVVTWDVGKLFIVKVDSQGQGVWRKVITVKNVTATAGRIAGSFIASPDGKWLFLDMQLATTSAINRLITKLDTDGRPQWAKLVQLQHQTVVDPTEGVTWTGSNISEPNKELKAHMDVGASSLFLVGTYSNLYQHGSNPPPAFQGVYGVALDFDGKARWAKQYRVGPLTVSSGNTGSSDATSYPLVKVMADGSLTIAANRGATPATPSQAVTFKVKADGTLP